MIEKHFIHTLKTARFFSWGDFKNIPKNIWFVLHGYGQLASDFIDIFSGLSTKDHLFIAPEALSRFYIEGFDGKIGASWMTREEREKDIEDYIKYLNNLYEEIVGDKKESINLHVLGFSQGAATATRWLAFGQANIKSLFLWSGLFPPDVPFNVKKELFEEAKIFLVYGDHDKFMNLEKIKKRKTIIDNEGISYEEIIFKGRHELKPDLLKKIIRKNKRIFS